MPLVLSEDDISIAEESALAMAQAYIGSAMRVSNTGKHELSGLIEKPIDEIMKGDHDLTIKEMARVLALCGYELRFSLEPLQIGKQSE